MSKVTDVSAGDCGDRVVPAPEPPPSSNFSKVQNPRAGWCCTGRSAQALATGGPSAFWGSLPPCPAPAWPRSALGSPPELLTRGQPLCLDGTQWKAEFFSCFPGNHAR